MERNDITYHSELHEPWKITLVDTGQNTMTGGRLKKIQQYLNSDTFCMTYGDGLSNVDIHDLVQFHFQHQKMATVTAVQPPGRFGILNLSDFGNVVSFEEKPLGSQGWINGGFFVLNSRCLEYIDDDSTVWEQDPLKKLTINNELMAFQHSDFWQPMDTLRDKNYLTSLWLNNNAPWQKW